MKVSDVITDKAEYGAHIALYCINHLELRWSTKNIDYIGARTIFFDSRTGLECSCPPTKLRAVLEEN